VLYALISKIVSNANIVNSKMKIMLEGFMRTSVKFYLVFSIARIKIRYAY